MLKLFSRVSPTARLSSIKATSAFQPLNQYRMVNTINNEEFKGSNLFDCSHITAIVTGGATGTYIRAFRLAARY